MEGMPSCEEIVKHIWSDAFAHCPKLIRITISYAPDVFEDSFDAHRVIVRRKVGASHQNGGDGYGK